MFILIAIGVAAVFGAFVIVAVRSPIIEDENVLVKDDDWER
jgi:hypothetical protein